MKHQSDEMIQYLSWPSKAADLICSWTLKHNFNEQYCRTDMLTLEHSFTILLIQASKPYGHSALDFHNTKFVIIYTWS